MFFKEKKKLKEEIEAKEYILFAQEKILDEQRTKIAQLEITNADLLNCINKIKEPPTFTLKTNNETIIAKEPIKEEFDEEYRQSLISECAELKKEIERLENKYIELDDAVLLQEFGLYEPKYNFTEVEEYKTELSLIRERQKTMVKMNTAAICDKEWTINGSLSSGKKFIKENIKQIIRTFNVECDHAIEKTRFHNIETQRKKIHSAFDTLNSLNEQNKIRITPEYLSLKYLELNLAYEYYEKKEEQKEELRRLREQQREEQKLAKELEERRKDIYKEQKHYEIALQKINVQLAEETDEERIDSLIQKKNEIEKGILDAEKALSDIDYREANIKAGYVYIISNIGSFGENVYKIGMTRRLEPQDRIDELGDASVPFKFDVHAMIFSSDAPKLEAALHKAFENKKLNAINGRKEFFNVTLEEIEAVVKANHDKAVEFKRYAEAQQYRETQKLRLIQK